MDFSKFSKPEVRQFIADHLHENPADLILKGSPFADIPITELANQISAKNKIRKKLPTWYASEEVVYPPNLNLSQSSSEKTAAYKSELVSGKKLVDITGGFGIDDFYFAKKMEKVVHCELDFDLSERAQYNFGKLSDRQNIEFHQSNGLNYLKNQSEKVDWIYADPARRSDSGQKLYQLEDTIPNVLENLDLFHQKSDHILLKTSPLLDLKLGIEQLKKVREIHIVSVKNEVKELLWILDQEANKEPLIKTIDLDRENTEYTSSLAAETTAETVFSEVQSFLYEPNAAILKAGFFKKIAEDFGVYKLAPNTHLYTSEEVCDFPGRKFEVIQILSVHKKEIKKAGLKKANISTRNFPMSPEQIKKKMGLKDGGNEYLFFTELANGKKILIWCRKL